MVSPIITLLTDFGDVDGFVGTMKGVIYGINPDVKIVDISHKIEPQNIAMGAFVLNSSYRFFPSGTIHIVVVDPGVGSERRILCVSANGHYFLAPDNGVLKYVYHNCSDVHAVHVSNKEYFLPHVSNTFHGRDVFAPVAAHLSRGLNIAAFGPIVSDYVKGEVSSLKEAPGVIKGNIVYIDHFGNLISNIPFNKIEDKVERGLKICLKNETIATLSISYSEAEPDEPIALISSSGFLEVACNYGNAKQKLNCHIGEEITVFYNN